MTTFLTSSRARSARRTLRARRKTVVASGSPGPPDCGTAPEYRNAAVPRQPAATVINPRTSSYAVSNVNATISHRGGQGFKSPQVHTRPEATPGLFGVNGHMAGGDSVMSGRMPCRSTAGWCISVAIAATLTAGCTSSAASAGSLRPSASASTASKGAGPTLAPPPAGTATVSATPASQSSLAGPSGGAAAGASGLADCGVFGAGTGTNGQDAHLGVAGGVCCATGQQVMAAYVAQIASYAPSGTLTVQGWQCTGNFPNLPAPLPDGRVPYVTCTRSGQTIDMLISQ